MSAAVKSIIVPALERTATCENSAYLPKIFTVIVSSSYVCLNLYIFCMSISPSVCLSVCLPISMLFVFICYRQ